jgi:Flp pilus assembly secretin CpaC
VSSGEAGDAVSAARAVDVAKALSTGPVIDAMKVAPSQQVMLQVRFLEVDRNAGRDLGVKLVRRQQVRCRVHGPGHPTPYLFPPGAQAPARSCFKGRVELRFSTRP